MAGEVSAEHEAMQAAEALPMDSIGGLAMSSGQALLKEKAEERARHRSLPQVVEGAARR